MKSITEYIREYKSIQKELNFYEASRKKAKIAVLSSSTIKGLHEVLFVKCVESGIMPDIFVGEYNQYYQEIADGESKLNRFKPDIIFLYVDLQSLLGTCFLNYFQMSLQERQQILEDKLQELRIMAETIKTRQSCKVVFHNLQVPVYSALGIIDNKQDLGFIEFTRTLNSRLVEAFKKDNQIFVFDFDLFCSKWGKDNLLDYKMYYIGDFKFNMKYYPQLCDEYMAYIKPLLSLTKKCIVLDLDNTLWGGIIGEDGIEGIRLGPTSAGRPFAEFQQHLLSLLDRGVILAVNSKNNLQDAMIAIQEHPYMVLKEKHFASIQINWNDKVANMKAIANELNIGLDSLVFFDDDKLNRELVREELPEVTVVELPEDPSLYLKTLMELRDFNSFYLSEEDKKKGQMYAEQRKRVSLSSASTDITGYLKALNMTITIEKATSFNIPRISQLTQKTNQFNLTTRRYMEEEIRKFAESKDHLVFSIQVEDKFGDNGITGAAIIRERQHVWEVDTFLLSCRIIGRRIEESMLIYILKEAKKSDARSLVGHFIPTKKNVPAVDFYKDNGFTLIEENESVQTWVRPIEKQTEYLNLYTVIEK